MSKFKKIIAFLLALLDFLFHLKEKPDEKVPDVMVPVPTALPPDSEERDEPLFETVL